MPKNGNLQNCKIYKIISLNNPDDVFYGMTTDRLNKLFSKLKTPSSDSLSKKITEKGDGVILLVENFPCDTIDEAKTRLIYYIINNPCINKQTGLTKKQYNKQYKENNKEKTKEYARRWRSKKTEILETI